MNINALLTRDKPLHFTYGALIAQPFVALTRSLPYEYRVVTGLVAGLIVGLTKEMHDTLVRRGRFSTSDFAATALGGMFTGLLG